MKVSPKMLKARDGTEEGWGVRIELETADEETPQVGDVVTVRTKSGDTFPKQIEKIVWSDNMTFLCRTCDPPRQPRSARAPKEQTTLPVDARIARHFDTPERVEVDPGDNWAGEDDLPF